MLRLGLASDSDVAFRSMESAGAVRVLKSVRSSRRGWSSNYKSTVQGEYPFGYGNFFVAQQVVQVSDGKKMKGVRCCGGLGGELPGMISDHLDI